MPPIKELPEGVWTRIAAGEDVAEPALKFVGRTTERHVRFLERAVGEGGALIAGVEVVGRGGARGQGKGGDGGEADAFHGKSPVLRCQEKRRCASPVEHPT